MALPSSSSRGPSIPVNELWICESIQFLKLGGFPIVALLSIFCFPVLNSLLSFKSNNILVSSPSVLSLKLPQIYEGHSTQIATLLPIIIILSILPLIFWNPTTLIDIKQPNSMATSVGLAYREPNFLRHQGTQN